ncbi:MAG: peptidyl-prolyl cis-trans isomerase SurA [Paraglaciecola psychrophila]|jgi:peptidyl-prolyl cis-trans isomerase SurA
MKTLIKLFSHSNTPSLSAHSVTAAARRPVLGLLLGFASALATAASSPIDKIVAIVDDDIVLYSELYQRSDQIEKKIAESGQPAPPPEKLRRDILDQLILENIQMQLARRAGVRISDAELTDSIKRIANQNNMTIAQFTEVLASDGQNYGSFREQMRKDMILQRIQRGHVNQRIQIAEQEIANFLASAEGVELTAPQYRMLHTLVPVSANSETELKQQARLYAEQLYSQIQEGQDYLQTMQSNSQFTLNVNDLGWRSAKELPAIVAGLVGTLGKGETATPFESGSGYHLVMLADTRGDGEIVAQTKGRHILLTASAIRDEQATQDQLNGLRQQIVDGADFAMLARTHSEDIGSAAEGGDLGWTTPGQLVGAFQDAMDSTDIDGISPIFQSQFGWHLLQVQGRRDKDMIDTLRSNMARNFIHQRKYDDELQAWLQKVRDEAYVDIK